MKVIVAVLVVFCATANAQIFIPNCSPNELKTLWPYYENNHYYYNCLGIGQTVLVRCNGYTLFSFERQSCTGQGSFIPPPDPEYLPTEFPPTNGNPTPDRTTTIKTTTAVTIPSTSTRTSTVSTPQYTESNPPSEIITESPTVPPNEILPCSCAPVTDPPKSTTQLTDAPTITSSTIPGPPSPPATADVPVPPTQVLTPPAGGIGPPTPVPTVKMK